MGKPEAHGLIHDRWQLVRSYEMSSLVSLIPLWLMILLSLIKQGSQAQISQANKRITGVPYFNGFRLFNRAE